MHGKSITFKRKHVFSTQYYSLLVAQTATVEYNYVQCMARHAPQIIKAFDAR